MEHKESMRNLDLPVATNRELGFSAASMRVYNSFSTVRDTKTEYSTENDDSDLDDEEVHSLEWQTVPWTPVHFRVGVIVKYVDNIGLGAVGQIIRIHPDNVFELQDIDYDFDSQQATITLRKPDHCKPLDKEGQLEIGNKLRSLEEGFHGMYDSESNEELEDVEQLLAHAAFEANEARVEVLKTIENLNRSQTKCNRGTNETKRRRSIK